MISFSTVSASSVCNALAPPDLETTSQPILEQYWRIGNSSRGFNMQGVDRCSVLLSFWAYSEKNSLLEDVPFTFSHREAKEYLQSHQADTRNIQVGFVSGRNVPLYLFYDLVDASFWRRDKPELLDKVMAPFQTL